MTPARPQRRQRERLPRLLAAIAAALLAACGRARAAPAGGPVVLITLDALRADVVSGLGGDGGGAPALTPNLAALIRQADWAGSAVASSSWAVPAMASLFTGLSPWQHHALLAGDARFADDLITLPKVFKTLGYRTSAFTSGRWFTPELGYDRGFDTFDVVGRNRDAAEHLASLEEGKELVWVHMPEPQAPWVRRDWLLPRLGERGAGETGDLPAVVTAAELEPYSDPATPLPAHLRRRFWSMYRLNAAWADEKIGRLLEATRASGQWDNALVVVTSDYGLQMGEHGTVGQGGDLRRENLEVPLIIKLPSWCKRPLVPPRQERVALARVWATLVEAAGGQPPPAMAASLFRGAPRGALSELYLADGSNLFSLVEDDDQLLWESRFLSEPRPAGALPTPRAAVAAGGSPEDPNRRTRQLLVAFAATPPLTGSAPPRLTLERWGPHGGSRPLADRARTAALARRLAARWRDFLSDELTPEEEDREWIDQLPSPAGAGAPGGDG